MKKEISCGFLLIREFQDGPRFLLLKSRCSDFYWEFPKGHSEEGEEYFETAVRELYEETSIKEQDIEVHRNEGESVSHFYEYTNDKGSLRHIRLFLAKTSKDPVLSDEHFGFMWANREEAKRYLAYEETVTFFDELVKKMKL